MASEAPVETATTVAAEPAAPATTSSAGGIFDIMVKDIKGREHRFGEFAEGKVTLVVNTASACGFTPQYKELEELYQKYKDRGFTIVGFPCNQFGSQEKGTEEEIEKFVCEKFKVSFPMFAKIKVNGSDAHPLYQHLKKEKSGFLGLSGIKWNFSKFLLDKRGEVVDRYAPTTSPAKLGADVEKLL